MASTYVFDVKMTCKGCSDAVERVLNRLIGQGVESVETSLEEQKVFVTSTLSPEQIGEVIKKTGKETKFVGPLQQS